MGIYLWSGRLALALGTGNVGTNQSLALSSKSLHASVYKSSSESGRLSSGIGIHWMLILVSGSQFALEPAKIRHFVEHFAPNDKFQLLRAGLRAYNPRLEGNMQDEGLSQELLVLSNLFRSPVEVTIPLSYFIDSGFCTVNFTGNLCNQARRQVCLFRF